MERLSLILIIVCVFVVTGCNSSDDASDTDTENDTDTDTDTDTEDECEPETQSECEDVITEEEYEFQALFECPTCVSIPADFAFYKNYDYGNEVSDFFDTAWSIAMDWFDESCVEECDIVPPQIECLEADCVTDEGATMVYSYIKTEEVVEYPQIVTTIEESLTINPPVKTESWEEIALYKYNDDRVSDWDGSIHHTDYSIAWQGLLKDEWPPDYQVAGVERSADWSSRSIEWSHENCDLSVRHTSDEAGDIQEKIVEIGENLVRVEQIDKGELTCNGWATPSWFPSIDCVTWEILCD